MAEIPGWSTAIPVVRDGPESRARVRVRRPPKATERNERLLRETLAACAAHPGPVLAAAWFGFAAIAILGQALSLLTGLTPATGMPVFLAGATASLLLQALAQGALARTGLRGNYPVLASQSARKRSAITSWVGIVPGTLVRSLLTFVVALSFTPLMVSSGLLNANLATPEASPDNWHRLTLTRSMDAAATGVLHPMAVWLSPTRIALRPVLLQAIPPDPNAYLDFAMRNHMDPSSRILVQTYYVPMAVLPAGLIALAGLALLVGGGLLLRFYAAAAVDKASTVKGARVLLWPLLQSVRLGAQHWRAVLTSAVLLSLLSRLGQIVCLVMTASAVEAVVLPQIAWTTSLPWLVTAGRLADVVGVAAVGALLAAFGEIFDARLYVLLDQEQDTVP